MHFMTHDDGEEDSFKVVRSSDLAPGEVAQMDQVRARAEELSSGLLLSTVLGLLLAREDEPDLHAIQVNAAKLAKDLMRMDRQEALGVINTALAALASNYVADNGGPEKTAEKIHLDSFKAAAAEVAVDDMGEFHFWDDEEGDDDHE